MLGLLFAVTRSRIVWVAISVATVAGVAFVFTVALAAAVMIASRGQDVDPDELAAVATSLGLLAAVAAFATMVSAWRVVRRARTLQWLPLREAMVRDAASVQDTYLVEIVAPSDPAVGGHLLATDLNTGGSGALWLPEPALPHGAVVCFTQTATGPRVRAWMTRRLWRACTREAARVEGRAAQAKRERHEVADERIRHAARQTVAAAEQLLREHS